LKTHDIRTSNFPESEKDGSR